MPLRQHEVYRSGGPLSTLPWAEGADRWSVAVLDEKARAAKLAEVVAFYDEYGKRPLRRRRHRHAPHRLPLT